MCHLECTLPSTVKRNPYSLHQSFPKCFLYYEFVVFRKRLRGLSFIREREDVHSVKQVQEPRTRGNPVKVGGGGRSGSCRASETLRDVCGPFEM